MAGIIAYCGLLCDTCPIYVATRTPDKEEQARMRARVAQILFEHYAMRCAPGDTTDCDGCSVEEGRLFSACQNCAIRSCARSKGRKTHRPSAAGGLTSACSGPGPLGSRVATWLPLRVAGRAAEARVRWAACGHDRNNMRLCGSNLVWARHHYFALSRWARITPQRQVCAIRPEVSVLLR